MEIINCKYVLAEKANKKINFPYPVKSLKINNNFYDNGLA